MSERPLARLLEEVASGRAGSATDLAGRLRVDPQQLRLMLRQLAALGLIAPAPRGQACPAVSPGEPVCRRCPVTTACPLATTDVSWTSGAAVSWRLTPRGRALVRRGRPSPAPA
ncbi:MAG TPA: hypothetical protein VIK73_06045 [Limnochordales bacterium]